MSRVSAFTFANSHPPNARWQNTASHPQGAKGGGFLGQIRQLGKMTSIVSLA